MGNIYAVDNLETLNWELNTNEVSAQSNNLHIGFTKNAPIISFTNLQFGFELRKGEDIKQYGVYPPAGVKYVKSDQTYLKTIRLKTRPSQTYELYLWARNENKLIEKTFEITIPKPNKPFDSWVWEEEELRWKAPIERPEGDYEWNEDKQEWLELK